MGNGSRPAQTASSPLHPGDALARRLFILLPFGLLRQVLIVRSKSENASPHLVALYQLSCRARLLRSLAPMLCIIKKRATLRHSSHRWFVY